MTIIEDIETPAPRAVLLSVHTSPLAQAGVGDGGGMNVYVRSLADALCRAGVEVDVVTRRTRQEEPDLVVLPSGAKVHTLTVGGVQPLARDDFHTIIEPFARAMEPIAAGADLLHAHYWVSAGVAHDLKHALGIPLVVTFHTLAGDKREAGIHDDADEREEVERAAALRRSDRRFHGGRRGAHHGRLWQRT